MTGRRVALAVVKIKRELTVKEQLCVAGIAIGGITGWVAAMEHIQRNHGKHHRTNMEYLKAASSTESFK